MQQGSRALTDPFDIARGSLQGDKLACMLFELGQAMLLLQADPGRRLQQRCPNPVEPEWWCYSCMVTSTHATLHSLDRSAKRPSWDSEWVTKDSKTCLTCRSIWERTGEYLIAEKSVEYVDDNLFMEIMDEKPQPSHARATVVEARVVEETGSQRPPVQPTGGVADRSAARSTAHNECDDRGSSSSSEYSDLSSDDEQNPDPTDPAVRTLNNRMKQGRGLPCYWGRCGSLRPLPPSSSSSSASPPRPCAPTSAPGSWPWWPPTAARRRRHVTPRTAWRRAGAAARTGRRCCRGSRRSRWSAAR
jgi:hypothetical protein